MKKKLKIILISLISFIMSFILIIMPVTTIIIYESIFGARYETASWLTLDYKEYSLICERSDFEVGSNTIAGYKYSKVDQEVNGLVVVSHGLGGGGHNSYLPFINYFTDNGYLVFTYDCKGNDNSEGKSVGGLPEGIKDLDYALNHIKTIEEYKDLPICLFGHSWGGYSVGNVLNLHSEVKAVTIVAGFNESEDLILYQGKQMLGDVCQVLLPYVSLYENLKYGSEYTNISSLEGFEKTEAGVIVVHSKDDTTVPMDYGYSKYYEQYSENDRFDFILYNSKGHERLLYSEEANMYRDYVNIEYTRYVESHGGEHNVEIKEEFFKNIDLKRVFEVNTDLMNQVISMYDQYCLN